MQNIYIIIGRSGSGKTSVMHALCRDYGHKAIKTATTRPRRHLEGDSYYFMSQEEFDAVEMIAPTRFAGNSYGLPPYSLDTGNLIIMDLKGIHDMKEKYKGERGIKVIGIHCPMDELERRMLERGDGKDDINIRLEHDETLFGLMDDFCDIVIHNKSLPDTVRIAQEYIMLAEKGGA